MKLDRRVMRTRHKLQWALIELMIENGYENCTVQHVLDRADVSRSTFYVHFRDKEDLFVSSIANLRAGLMHEWKAGGKEGKLGFARPFLKHVEGNEHVWRGLVRGESGRIIDREFRQMLTAMARKDLGVRSTSGASKHAVVACIVGALMAMVEFWMTEPAQGTAESMNQLFLDAMLPGIQALGL